MGNVAATKAAKNVSLTRRMKGKTVEPDLCDDCKEANANAFVVAVQFLRTVDRLNVLTAASRAQIVDYRAVAEDLKAMDRAMKVAKKRSRTCACRVPF